MNLIAKLIDKGFGTRVFYVMIDGFDTHSGQAEEHQRLLTELSDSIGLLFANLKKSGNDKRTVLRRALDQIGVGAPRKRPVQAQLPERRLVDGDNDQRRLARTPRREGGIDVEGLELELAPLRRETEQPQCRERNDRDNRLDDAPASAGLQ